MARPSKTRAVRRSRLLALRLKAVADFRTTFERYAETIHYLDGIGGFPGTWEPKPERDAESARLRSEVNRLCGPAAQAAGEMGMTLHLKPPGQMGPPFVPVNPIANWSDAFDAESFSGIGPGTVFDFTDRLVGALWQPASASSTTPTACSARWSTRSDTSPSNAGSCPSGRATSASRASMRSACSSMSRSAWTSSRPVRPRSS
jgi:hypothetical protein